MPHNHRSSHGIVGIAEPQNVRHNRLGAPRAVESIAKTCKDQRCRSLVECIHTEMWENAIFDFQITFSTWCVELCV